MGRVDRACESKTKVITSVTRPPISALDNPSEPVALPAR
jgi:hypothetical protein